VSSLYDLILILLYSIVSHPFRLRISVCYISCQATDAFMLSRNMVKSIMDASLFLYINQGPHNNFLDASMLFITNRGYLLFVAVIAPLFFKDWRKGLIVFVLCAAGFIVADHTSDVLKNLIARPRPCDELQNVRLLVPCLASFSFPSGHASTSFAMASIIAYFFRRGAIPAFIISVLVAYSRIYVGVHYPSDVLGGAYLGVVTGGCIIAVHNRAAKYLTR